MTGIRGFEGGQMPLHRRMPKRGFNNIFAKDYAELNLGRLQQAIEAGRVDAKQPITAETFAAGSSPRRATACACSARARSRRRSN